MKLNQIRNLTALSCNGSDVLELPSQSLPIFEVNISYSLWADICEIQAAWGVPVDVLIRDIFEDFVSEHWDLKHNRKKPGLQSGRRRKNF
ncbi:MAG: hypothetical protein ACM3SR_08070 [Ignavibacteriales bacterium]|jgi:uncharacterized protein YbdZ (MbtH family)